MRRFLWMAAVLGGMSLAAGAGEGEEPEGLQVGDPAPAFALPGTDGKTHRLDDYVGDRAVVVAWFPKAFTGG